jgi:hypothetical protein
LRFCLKCRCCCPCKHSGCCSCRGRKNGGEVIRGMYSVK